MYSKEHVIEQAMEMFVAQGIKAVRMDDIARRLGISKRTLYEQFGDKEELLYQCMHRYGRLRDERHAAIGARASNVLEAVLGILNDVRDTAGSAQRLRSNLMRFYPRVYARLEREHDAQSGRREMGECLALGIEEGFFSPRLDIELSITLLYHAIAGIMSPSELRLPEGVDPFAAFGKLMIHFLRGISTPRGLQLIDDHLERQSTAETLPNEPSSDKP